MVFYLLLMISANFLNSTELTQNIFDSAVELYQNKNYEQALLEFEKIRNEKVQNADLYYNIGNCHYRLQELGEAVLNYKIALKIDPTHQAARRNLRFVLTQTKDKQQLDHENRIFSFWQKIFNSMSINLLSLLSLIFFLLVILIIDLIILRYAGREKTAPIFIMIIAIIFLVIFATLTAIKYHEFRAMDEAVLLSPSAIGYSGPSAEFTRVFTIHEGMIFNVEKEQNGWSLIKLKNGLGGWIKKDNFRRVTF